MCTRSALARALALLALLAAAPARGGPAALDGRLERGARRVEPLPTGEQAGGFWHLVLQGDGAADLDLEVLGVGNPGWASRRVGAHEELLVPAEEGLRALLTSYGGGSSQYRLELRPVTPGAALTPGARVEGELDATGGRFAVHPLPALPRGFQAATLRATGEPDLVLHLHDERFAPVASARPGEPLLLGARAERGWLVVEARRGAGGYALGLEAAGAEAPLLPRAGELALVAGGPREARLELSPEGPQLVRLEGPEGGALEACGPEWLRASSAGQPGRAALALPAGRGECLVRLRGEAGAGRLVAERLDGAGLAPAPADAAPRTWALVVGVSRYAQVSGLRYPASDALRLLERLRRLGALAPRQAVVLLDQGATRAAVLAALEAIAARARPQDRLLLCWSGHGDQTPDGARGDPRDEADGQDELLACHDARRRGGGGCLTDDELRACLDRIPAREQVLLVDACYAGGLAELCQAPSDGAPGRFGVLSSQEGELSAEATRYGTGLLTGVVLRGLSGAADADRDGAVSAAELGRFVAEVVPVTCPISQDRLGPDDERCRGCGRDVTRDGARQVPVVAGALAAEAAPLVRLPAFPRERREE